MPDKNLENFFAPCPRGLEAALDDELTSLGAQYVKHVPGGVHFAGDLALCYRANLESRLASRILRRIAQGGYQKEDDIYRLARAVDWPQIFAVERTIKIATSATRSPLRSLDFVTLKVKDAVCDRFRDDCQQRPNVDTQEPDIRIQVFLSPDDCTLYLDTSGAPLWQRGLRQKTTLAPLKENLAAGILRLTGWQAPTPLYDPMCGSGTFLLEAAQMARRIAPGIRRSFAFERLADFDADLWRRIREAAKERELPAGEISIFGGDQSPAALRATLANLDRAGLLAGVHLYEPTDITEVTNAPAPQGLLVCNPPYGERVGELDALRAWYPLLGKTFKSTFAGWTCALISGELQLPKLIGLKPSRRTPLFNGAIECRLFEFKMVSGSNRRVPQNEAQQSTG